jgi:aspartate/methionine/tyrosine aminotransferase
MQPVVTTRQRVSAEGSPTLALARRIELARRAGVHALSLSTPQFPDSDLFPFLKDPISGQLGDPRGQLDARQLMRRRLFDHWPIQDDEIVLTSGAKSGLLVALLANIEPGSIAAIIEPSWPSYEDIARAAGLNCVGVPTFYSRGFALDCETLDRYASTASVVILSNPSNPTGRVYSADEIGEVVNWCSKRGCWLLIDESFSLTVETPSYFEKRKAWPYERMLVANSISKNFSLQGLRLGAIAGTAEAVEAIRRVQLGVLSPPSRPVQEIFIQLDTAEQLIPINLCRHRAAALEFIGKMDGWHCLPTKGTFYLFPRVPQLEVHLLQWEQHGSIFGLNGRHFGEGYADHLRFCFYRPIQEIEEIFTKLMALGS